MIHQPQWWLLHTQDQRPWLQAIRVHKHLHIRTCAIQKMVTSVQHTDSLEGVWSPSKSAQLEATGIRFHWRLHLVALRVSRRLVLSEMSKGILVHAKKVLELWFCPQYPWAYLVPAKWFWTNIKELLVWIKCLIDEMSSRMFWTGPIVLQGPWGLEEVNISLRSQKVAKLQATLDSS